MNIKSMKTAVKSLLFGLIVLILPPALADNPMTDLLSLTGSCASVRLYGKSVDRNCTAAMNTLYKNGRSGFYFVAENMVLTFSGNGDLQVRQDANTSNQAIDLILLSNPKASGNSNPVRLVAIGKCLFENPFLGKPTKLICSAMTENGEFEATFEHDGSEPKVLIQNGQNVTQ
jgi:hypothetical protein